MTSQSCFIYFYFSVCLLCLLCLFVCFFLSTIHGRIDQVNQLLELDYQKRGGARYTALDKWTNQLNTLNQAIVSKLTWWHVKKKIKRKGKMACFNTSIKYATVLQVYHPRQDTQHSLSQKISGTPWERVQTVLFCGDEKEITWHLFLFFMFLIGRSFHVQTHKCFSC